MSELSTPDEGPDRKKSQAVRVTAYMGPLPPPSQLAQYEQVVSGGAERIFRRFESQSEQRLKLEASIVRTDNLSLILGTVTSSVIGIVGVSGGIFLVHEGHSLEGFSSFFFAFSSLVGVYIYGKKSQAQPRSNSRRARID